jgi:hypothetical protein
LWNAGTSCRRRRAQVARSAGMRPEPMIG